MNYTLFTPAPILRPFIEKYYILDYQGSASEPPFDIYSPANCYTALVFNYGVPYQLLQGEKVQPLSGTFLAGYSTQGYQIRLQGQVGMVGAVFKSSVIRNWFSDLIHYDISNQRIPLEDLIGREIYKVNEQLAEASHPLIRIQIVESFLIGLLRRKNYPVNRADQAIQLIMNHRGMVRMDDLANQLNLSPRHFRRLFNTQVGLSPKFFARLKRFNYIRWVISRHVPVPWHEFVTDGGYYDQSHFIKDFVNFCGVNPSTQILQIRQSESRIITSD